MDYPVHFLENQSEFDVVMQQLLASSWIGFDTEFVGEKTFVPVLCLIQIVTEHDIYLIDTLKIAELTGFLRLVENPDILKITHAGDNDYRLLNTLFATVPNNTFDTQIAAGFVGYNYPAGFGKIVEKELRVNLAKSHTIADWEARPIEAKALSYAIEDVKYLPGLHQKLTQKLRRHKREEWAREENRKWESASFYQTDPYKEVLANDFIHQLDFKDKIFLMRLFAWRREKAAEYNIPKESVLQSRHISTVLRAAKDGANGFRSNRTLPEGIWRKFVGDWQALAQAPASEAEKAFLQALPKPAPDDPEREWAMELMYHFVKKQCIAHEISAALLFPKGDFNRLKAGNPDFDHSILEGWRAALLGENLVQWLRRGAYIDMSWQNASCILNMR